MKSVLFVCNKIATIQHLYFQTCIVAYFLFLPQIAQELNLMPLVSRPQRFFLKEFFYSPFFFRHKSYRLLQQDPFRILQSVRIRLLLFSQPVNYPVIELPRASEFRLLRSYYLRVRPWHLYCCLSTTQLLLLFPEKKVSLLADFLLFLFFSYTFSG